MFSTLSRAEFLHNSKNTYHETHEAMLAEQRAIKQRQKDAENRAKLERGESIADSKYKDQKSGRLIFEEEVIAKQLSSEIEAELKKRGISSDNQIAIAQVRRELREAKDVKRKEVVALIKLREKQLEDVKADRSIQGRSDSDQDLSLIHISEPTRPY